ncbi:hypothetical protein OCU04_008159 [Sclerotinia nivalis]|uniref:Uncharacterized protein n=1 Tax=Sclerotinia nivalis TaxID=352851 RepID=A0A9X0DGR3_9HELO|nr:hypothetical protein OCU04_008159 [Sclerotinia nivalis]
MFSSSQSGSTSSESDHDEGMESQAGYALGTIRHNEKKIKEMKDGGKYCVSLDMIEPVTLNSATGENFIEQLNAEKERRAGPEAGEKGLEIPIELYKTGDFVDEYTFPRRTSYATICNSLLQAVKVLFAKSKTEWIDMEEKMDDIFRKFPLADKVLTAEKLRVFSKSDLHEPFGTGCEVLEQLEATLNFNEDDDTAPMVGPNTDTAKEEEEGSKYINKKRRTTISTSNPPAPMAAAFSKGKTKKDMDSLVLA